MLELGDDGSGGSVYHVKATNGDNHLGGDNFDKAIVDWMIAEFKRDQGIDLGQDPMAPSACTRPPRRRRSSCRRR